MIDAIQVGFKYPRGNFVFRTYTFSVEEGKITAILGPNGRGKTTLIKCVSGLLSPTEGTIKVPAYCGYVPQNGGSIFSYPVKEMVVMGRSRHIPPFGTPRAKDYRIAESVLERLGLQGFNDRSFLELSGGERQLVLIARALASECRVLVLDEPTSSLDFKNQNTILSTLRDLSRRNGITIVFSTHSPYHAVHIADNVLLMYSQEEYLYGPTEKVMTERNLKRLYGLEIRRFSYESSHGIGNVIVPVFT